MMGREAHTREETMLTSQKLRTTLGCIAAASVVALLASCSSGAGSGDTSSASAGGKVNAKLAAMVPDSIKSDGKVVVATDPTYAPMELVAEDGSTITGVDPEIGAALGEVLGVKFTFVKSTFDAILPGLSAGKYELGMSSFTDTKEREKVLDFVTYFKAGTDLMVPAGNPKKLSVSDDSLCGLAVAAEKGTIQSDSDIPDRSKKCTDGGKKAIDEKVYPDQNAVNLALATGRVDAALADSGVAGYMAKQSDKKFEVVGEPYATAPYGIAVPKSDGKFAEALQGAVNEIIKNGTYKKILAKWASDGGAITSSEINAAQS